MPKYKKRDPEYTAIQFTGSNIREVMEELGPNFSTHYNLGIEGATNFVLQGYGRTFIVETGEWIVADHENGTWAPKTAEGFKREFEPIKSVGRPPKEKK